MSRENNFDLIRLFAALQVVIMHAFGHFQINYINSVSVIREILVHLPGVPIFFTISGFLICMSYEKKNDKYKFYINRFLRLYPALWISFVITVCILVFFNFINYQTLYSANFAFWCFTQLSFLQFYTPEFFRDFGVGTPNGSLWTIAVEIQFYFLIPLLYHLLIERRRAVVYNILLLITAVLSYIFFYVAKTAEETLLIKLLNVSLLPYLYNFIFGILLYKNFTFLIPYLKNKMPYWSIIYLTFIGIFSIYHPLTPNIYGLVATLLLSVLVIAASFSYTRLSRKLLKEYDFSYGIYIYHMLIINVLIEMGFTGDIRYVVFSICLSVCAGILSWILIEKKALVYKKVASI
jgi:peptidoglycan/LPS O-acetylase OafA/YrhL